MKQLLLAIAIFLTSVLVFSGIWWLSGFNFDHRGPDVAFNALLILIGSAMLTPLAFIYTE